MKNLYPNTLNDSCADLQQYPASKVQQLAKKLESSKATAQHIKQATSNAQAAQINLLQHQQTELTHKKKKGHKHKQHFKPKEGKPPYKKRPNPSQAQGSQDHCSKCGDTRHAQGFSCPVKKYLCKACKKYGHFTSLCFSKQKKSAYQITAEEMENHSASETDEDSYSDDSFILHQMKAEINLSQAKSKIQKKTHLIANIPYRIKQYQTHHKYLRVRLDTCADVNIMPRSVYPDTKKPQAVTFYVASNEGSVLLSCTTLLTLDLIQTRPHLDYLLPRAKLITSAADHPDITKKTAHQSKATMKPKPKQMNIVTKKSDIKEHYPDVFEGVGHFPGPPYHIQLDPKVPPRQTPVRPVPVHLKEGFQARTRQDVTSRSPETCT